MGILSKAICEPLDKVLLIPVLWKVTFLKLLFEIKNAEYVDWLPVKLHDFGEVVDINHLVFGNRPTCLAHNFGLRI